MAWYLVHGSTSLYKMNTTGSWSTLSLPVGVTVSGTRKARVALLNRWAVVVNAPSVNLQINADDQTAYVLSIDAPTVTASLATGSAGSPKGSFRYAYSFAITTGSGDDLEVITESPLSPTAGPITVNASQIDLSSLSTSSNASVTARILYRTATGGVDFYKVTTIENNTASTYSDNATDYDLSLIGYAEDKGNPPGSTTASYFRLIATWKDRLWASPDDNPDRLYFSGRGEQYSWGEENYFIIQPEGSDDYGVTALAARRDELVVFKRRAVWKVVGTGVADFQVIQVAEGIGCTCPEAVVVVRDSAYFLCEDGVYEYGPGGVQNLSRDQVHGWFNTDDYFARADFDNAFIKHNPLYDVLELHLPNASTTSINRWVTYDLRRRIWLGPHLTDAFTPTCGATVDDENALLVPVMGASNGYVYKENQTTATDAGTAIVFDVLTKWFSGNTPDITKYWGELALINKIETGGTLSVEYAVGGLDASTAGTYSLALTSGRHRLHRVGVGRFMRLRLYNNENTQSLEVYGFEIPFHELGRR